MSKEGHSAYGVQEITGTRVHQEAIVHQWIGTDSGTWND